MRGTGGLRGGTIAAHGDHRLAMLGAVAGLASREGVEVVGMEAAAVSYPGFTADLAASAQPRGLTRSRGSGSFGSLARGRSPSRTQHALGARVDDRHDRPAEPAPERAGRCARAGPSSACVTGSR